MALMKTVVACAGVCKSWRLIVTEIIKIPEISGKLTFPISVKQPGPKDGLLYCVIKRNRSTRTYYLYLPLTNALTDDGKFLLAARKCRRPTRTDDIISLQAGDMLKGSSAYVGKLRGPRRMQCIIESIPATLVSPEGAARTRSDFLAAIQTYFHRIRSFI